MLFTKCVCVNATSANWGFSDTVRDSGEKKQYTELVLASRQSHCQLQHAADYSLAVDILQPLTSIYRHPPTIAMLPFLSKSLPFPSWHPFLFYLYVLSSFHYSTNLPLSFSLLINFFHFVFCIVPFTSFLFFHCVFLKHFPLYPSVTNFYFYPFFSISFCTFILPFLLFFSLILFYCFLLTPLFSSFHAAIIFFSFSSSHSLFLVFCFPFLFFFLYVSLSFLRVRFIEPSFPSFFPFSLPSLLFLRFTPFILFYLNSLSLDLNLQAHSYIIAYWHLFKT
jgi:hypothetical protein